MSLSRRTFTKEFKEGAFRPFKGKSFIKVRLTSCPVTASSVCKRGADAWPSTA